MCLSFKSLFVTSAIVLVLSVLVAVYIHKKNADSIAAIQEWANANLITIDQNTEIQPFQIEFDQSEWDLLVQKLELSRYFTVLNDSNVKRSEFGFDPEYAKELVDYWKSGYSWKEKVTELNRFPQFKIAIDNDVTIHFVRYVTNKHLDVKKRIPVVLLDGWLGSFFGFYKMIDHIEATFKDDSFDILVPSMPGYGYSAPLRVSLSNVHIGRYFDALVRHLHGGSSYYIHGEDWGASVATTMAQMYPSRVKALHLSMPLVSDLTYVYAYVYRIASCFVPSALFSEQEMRLKINERFTLKYKVYFYWEYLAYMHIQSTKPDTLAHGLTDSPIGLLAYMLEKYAVASFDYSRIMGRPDGGLADHFDKDDLLTVVTYYWMTNMIASSMRLYKATLGMPQSYPDFNCKLPEQVVIGVQFSLFEPFILPEKIVKLRYQNLTRFSIIENGGHFAAFENSILVGNDFTHFVKSLAN